jgi:hypothetical protein
VNSGFLYGTNEIVIYFIFFAQMLVTTEAGRSSSSCSLTALGGGNKMISREPFSSGHAASLRWGLVHSRAFDF